MTFNHQQYNTTYLLNANNNGDAINDAEAYGVRIAEAEDVIEGELYWKVLGGDAYAIEAELKNRIQTGNAFPRG